VHIYNGILFDHKKNEILSYVVTQMNVEDVMLRERRQAQEDKYHAFSLICVS
jgi:hypothetical protein